MPLSRLCVRVNAVRAVLHCVYWLCVSLSLCVSVCASLSLCVCLSISLSLCVLLCCLSLCVPCCLSLCVSCCVWVFLVDRTSFYLFIYLFFLSWYIVTIQLHLVIFLTILLACPIGVQCTQYLYLYTCVCVCVYCSIHVCISWCCVYTIIVYCYCVCVLLLVLCVLLSLCVLCVLLSLSVCFSVCVSLCCLSLLVLCVRVCCATSLLVCIGLLLLVRACVCYFFNNVARCVQHYCAVCASLDLLSVSILLYCYRRARVRPVIVER